jgi:NADH-ubiquinone oxidoreductase chain 6
MLNLYSIYNDFNGFSISFLIFIAFVSLLSGVFIIITKNPIVSVLYLILLFSSIACYLIFIGIKFIGISYLLVYVGAVSILFLFILMLINIRVSELISDTNNNIPLAVLAVLAFFIPFSNVLPDNKTNVGVIQQTNFNILDIVGFKQEKQVSYVSSNSWDGNLVEISDIMSIGNIMYTSYSIWLIITSIILLLAMVGSIVITIKQKY